MKAGQGVGLDDGRVRESWWRLVRWVVSEQSCRVGYGGPGIGDAH